MTAYAHAQLGLRAVGRVSIRHVRIVLCLTIMQQNCFSVCHQTAKDCLINVANIMFIFILCEKVMTSCMYESNK